MEVPFSPTGVPLSPLTEILCTDPFGDWGEKYNEAKENPSEIMKWKF